MNLRKSKFFDTDETDAFREISIHGINYGITLKTFDKKENLDFLIDSALSILDIVENKKNEVD